METDIAISSLTEKYPQLQVCQTAIENAGKALTSCYKQGGKLLVCGNGGSSSDSDHIVGELMKSFEKKREITNELREALKKVSEERGSYIASLLQGSLPAISLNAHSGLVSAISNDIDPSLIFAQQVQGYGKEKDVFLGITTSGNSQNVIDAAIVAKAKGMTVIGLTGKGGGRLKEYSDICIAVPASNTASVQELHLPIYHSLCKLLENNLFKK